MQIITPCTLGTLTSAIGQKFGSPGIRRRDAEDLGDEEETEVDKEKEKVEEKPKENRGEIWGRARENKEQGPVTANMCASLIEYQ